MTNYSIIKHVALLEFLYNDILANFLILNTAVLLPTYGQPATDDLARRQLQRAFPRHDIVPVDCRVLIRQHGSLHCSTMQFPVGVLE